MSFSVLSNYYLDLYNHGLFRIRNFFNGANLPVPSQTPTSSFILKTSIFPLSSRAYLGLDLPSEMKPFHVSLNTAHSGCKPRGLHIILHTFIPSLPPANHTSHPCHHHISIGRHPIILTLRFHMPKPPQSTLPHHLIDDKSTLHFLSFSNTPHIHLTIIPSVLSRLCRFQIRCFLHGPGLSPICQCTLDTSLVYLSLSIDNIVKCTEFNKQ